MESTPKPKRKIVKKVIIGILIAAVVLTNAWMAVQYHSDFATPNTLSGILEDIKGIPSEWMYKIEYWQQDRAYSKELNQPVSPNFDNSNDSVQIVQAGINTATISEEELPALLVDTIPPVVKNEFPKPTILLPFKLTDGEIIDVVTYWNRAFNPIDSHSNAPTAAGKIFTISKKGTQIIVPVEGAKVHIGYIMVNNTKYPAGYSIDFNGPDGTEYFLGITTEDTRLLQPTAIMKNAFINDEANVSLSVGSPIAFTSTNNVKIRVTLQAYPPGYSKTTVGLYCNYNLVEKDENGKMVVAFLPQSTP